MNDYYYYFYMRMYLCTYFLFAILFIMVQILARVVRCSSLVFYIKKQTHTYLRRNGIQKRNNYMFISSVIPY